ncbi:MAG: 3-methyl-2-oxobutanoate hydroxymethyltransferase [Acidobacteriota bacterium]
MSKSRKPVTVPAVAARKRRHGDEPLVMVTAYDHPSAVLADRAGVDLLLVGDSLGMVIQGKPDTLQVTLDEMIYHCACVSRAGTKALVVGDLPWMTYHVSREDAVRNAGRIIQEGGARSVKLEGARPDTVRAIVDAEIPVMGHLGLTPQSVNVLGGFKLQGRDEAAAEAIREGALRLQDAGAFAVVLECVPAELGERVSEELDIPTIGIGAGPACDGQVLVWHDLLGVSERVPSFVRRYESLGDRIVEALESHAADVRSGEFPGPDESRYLAQPTGATEPVVADA